ncbi:MAG TPA: hypothetical protein VGD62_07075 [Acidobacteriaceae bacterium]
MPHQPNLFSPGPGGGSSPESTGAAGGRKQEYAPGGRRASGGASVWLRRTELLVRVVVRLYLGLLVAVLPWLHFWTENGLLGATDVTAFLAHSGFVRGAVSGLGVLNVVIALEELFTPARSS